MTHPICYVNGDFVPLSQASLPVQDLAILRGYGVFDFLRTYHGYPFKLREHLKRLQNSAEFILLSLPATLSEIEALVLETLRRNQLPEANVRIIISGGVSPDGISAPDKGGLLIIVTPPHPYPEDYYRQGVKVITVNNRRYIPQAKTINYIPGILALKQAHAAGALEAIYVNEQQHILEGTTTNFFVFQGRQLITPDQEILPGVTRDVVLELARPLFDVVERPIVFDDIAAADEAFITASNKEVMPVNLVDDIQIGDGQVGSNTRKLMEAFRQLTRS